MSTKIRLKRIGRKNRPYYRIVVIDSRKRRDGAALEELGWYNPIESKEAYKINEERVFHWLKEGAQVSDTVNNLLKDAGISFKWHLMRQGLNEKEAEKELQKWQLKQAEKAKKKAAAKPAPAVKKEETDEPETEITAEEPAAADDQPEPEKETAPEEPQPDAKTELTAEEKTETEELNSSEEESAEAEPTTGEGKETD